MKSKVVIFGAWQEGINLFFEIQQIVDVVAFIDNNLRLQSKEIYGIRIISPDDLEQIEYDEIFISSSKYFVQMLAQLRSMNVQRSRIKIVFGISSIREQFQITKRYMEANITNYETRWSDLKKKYGEIYLYMLDVSCIGEMVGRLWKMIEDEQSVEKNILRIFLPVIGSKRRICNEELLELAGEKLHIAKDNMGFWEYVLNVHGYEVEILDYNRYLYRDMFIPRIIERNYAYFTFRKSQIELGKRKMAEIGITGEYVCFLARSSEYAHNTLADMTQMISNIEVHEYRNSDFGDYKKAIDYLRTMNLQAVRMGRGENPIGPVDNCIDYAGLYADDFMDIFLMANCKFAVIGGGAGVFSLATSFGRPVLFANLIPVSLGNGGENYGELDLYIPKKMFNREKKEYMSLRKMTELENECLMDGRKYKDKGIVFVNNSPDEILEAVQELLAKMENCWKETEEDIYLYNQYLSIFTYMDNRSKVNTSNWVGGAMRSRLSISYLKKNLYLLE